MTVPGGAGGPGLAADLDAAAAKFGSLLLGLGAEVGCTVCCWRCEEEAPGAGAGGAGAEAPGAGAESKWRR